MLTEGPGWRGAARRPSRTKASAARHPYPNIARFSKNPGRPVLAVAPNLSDLETFLTLYHLLYQRFVVVLAVPGNLNVLKGTKGYRILNFHQVTCPDGPSATIF